MAGMNNVTWTNTEVKTFLGIIGEKEVQRQLDGSVRNEKVFKLVAQRMAAQGFTRTSDQCRSKCKKLRGEYRKIKEHNSQSGVQRKTWRWFDMMDAIYGCRPASRAREGAMDPGSSLMDSASPLLDSMLEPIDESPSSGIVVEVKEEDDVPTECSTSPCNSPARPSTPAPREEVWEKPSNHSTTSRGRKTRGQSDIAMALRAMQASDERQFELMQAAEERQFEQQRVQFNQLLDDAREARRHEAMIMEQTSAFHGAFLKVLSQMVNGMVEHRDGANNTHSTGH